LGDEVIYSLLTYKNVNNYEPGCIASMMLLLRRTLQL